MFERYNEKARRVIFFARYEAFQFGSPSIEPEYILLGLVRENTDLFVDLLQIPDPYTILSERIERQMGGEKRISTTVELPLSASAKQVLMCAYEESEALGHQHIGPEHLLLGVLSEGGPFAAQIINESGIELEELRERIRKENKNS